MHRSRFALIALASAALASMACAAVSVAASARETIERGWYGAVDRLEPAFAFIGSLFLIAFPVSSRAVLATAGYAVPRTLGGPQARSFRSRWLSRQTDGRERAPLAAAFVPA